MANGIAHCFLVAVLLTFGNLCAHLTVEPVVIVLHGMCLTTHQLIYMTRLLGASDSLVFWMFLNLQLASKAVCSSSMCCFTKSVA